MHDIRLIRDDPAAFDKGLADRGMEPLAAELIHLDEARRGAIAAHQAAQERRNALSKEIGAAKKAGDELKAQSLVDEVGRLKAFQPIRAGEERSAVKVLQERLAEIPNTPAPDVPVGVDETDNLLRHAWGKAVALANRKQHFELAEAWRLGARPGSPGVPMMDFEAASRLAGTRFVVLRGDLARLERALGQFMLDLHTTQHGYQEVSPPLMVLEKMMYGTAQLPKFFDDQFLATRPAEFLHEALFQPQEEMSLYQYLTEIPDVSYRFDELGVAGSEASEMMQGAVRTPFGRWLIPTAEVPLTNLVREQILSEDDLPLRFTALTPCFRAEAGAAGRDTRGMLRQHQFVKCELVSITTPERSEEEHERMLGCAEAVLQALDLPYRVVTLCTGDMGFAARKTYDIEVWLPGQGTFREISSCSNCGDFQARRMEARFRPKEGKGPRLVHTLNGSGVAVGRALIAVLENGQQPDGSVVIPERLRPYMGGIERIGG